MFRIFENFFSWSLMDVLIKKDVFHVLIKEDVFHVLYLWSVNSDLVIIIYAAMATSTTISE